MAFIEKNTVKKTVFLALSRSTIIINTVIVRYMKNHHNRPCTVNSLPSIETIITHAPKTNKNQTNKQS